ncbi:MAG TPA: hypothetical protein VGR37_02760 [Longimicrobiaceae bacterium]|nr:hypothetical protein [Longimicrobiaceae bacterium]
MSTGPDDRRVVGIVEWVTPGLSLGPQGSYAPGAPADPMAQAVLEAPDTVVAGTPFDVVVRTYGADGCWREAGAETAATGLSVAITPHDRHEAGAGVMCTMAVVRLPRTLRVSFPQRGQGVIRVTGRKVLFSNGSVANQGSVTVEKQVVVR